MKQKTLRQKFDLYETPGTMVDDLLNYYSDWFRCLHDSGHVIFEPCVGNGAILSPLKKFYAGGSEPKFVTNDIQQGLGDYWLDAADDQVWTGAWKDLYPDLIITNPPYNQAFDILRNAQKYARVGVVMLLRLSFLEPTKKRGMWLKNHPPLLVRVYGSPRPKFTEPSTDTVTTAWMCWLNNSYLVKDYNTISFAIDWR